eukprot:scaffold130241_cov65-Attheya_sp.AAC.10
MSVDSSSGYAHHLTKILQDLRVVANRVSNSVEESGVSILLYMEDMLALAGLTTLLLGCVMHMMIDS